MVTLPEGVSMTPLGGAGGLVKLSTTLPCTQSTSFTPPPGGPQMKAPSIPAALKCSRSGPQSIARNVENEGGGQGQAPPQGVAQRQLPSSSSWKTPVPTVTCTTPLCGEVLS